MSITNILAGMIPISGKGSSSEFSYWPKKTVDLKLKMNAVWKYGRWHLTLIEELRSNTQKIDSYAVNNL